MAELLARFEGNVQKLTSTRKRRKKGATAPEVLKGFGFETPELTRETVAQLIDMQHEELLLRVKLGPSREHKTTGVDVRSVTVDALIAKVISTRKRTKVGTLVVTTVAIESAKLNADQVADLTAMQELRTPPEVTIQCDQGHLAGTRASDLTKKKRAPRGRKKKGVTVTPIGGAGSDDGGTTVH